MLRGRRTVQQEKSQPQSSSSSLITLSKSIFQIIIQSLRQHDERMMNVANKMNTNAPTLSPTEARVGIFVPAEAFDVADEQWDSNLNFTP